MVWQAGRRRYLIANFLTPYAQFIMTHIVVLRIVEKMHFEKYLKKKFNNFIVHDKIVYCSMCAFITMPIGCSYKNLKAHNYKLCQAEF